MRRCLRFALAFVFAPAFIYPCIAQQSPGPSQVPEVARKLFAEGQDFEERKQLTSAADSYRAASKAAAGKCIPCLESLAQVQMRMGTYKDSAATSAQLVALSTDARSRAEAQRTQGLAFYQLSLAEKSGEGSIDKNPKHADASLQKAEAAFRQAIADDPSDEPARMAHAHTLAALKRDDEARSEFAACAATPGASPAECARALRFAANVSTARGEPVPAFEIKSMDGKTVSLDSLAGKVVLMDFWATWCTWCKRDSDYVQSMLDSFDADHFVLLEVNVDENQEVWKNYVKEQRMQGLQVYDQGHYLQDLFHVSGFPTYVIFDGDGIVQNHYVGAKGDLRGDIRGILKPAPLPPHASPGN